MNKPTQERIAQFIAGYILANNYDIVDTFMESQYPDDFISVDSVESQEYKDIEKFVHNQIRTIAGLIERP